MNAVINDEYLSVSEVALKLGVSAPTIRRPIATGELPSVKLGQDRNSPVRVSRKALAEWLERSETGDVAA
jgi:excisionase family DNA binding protein